MTSKFLMLSRLRVDLPVPPLTLIDDADLASLWLNHAALRAQISAVMQQIKVTAAAFLDEHMARLPSAAEVEWMPGADAILAAKLATAGLTADEALAVRSSATVEDGAAHSFAGVFESCLDVRGVHAMRHAIVQVWLSTISRAAIIQRMRLGDAGLDVGMTIILQRMVQARWAGVAFSHDPMTGSEAQFIEAVPHLADGLVSGVHVAAIARVDGGRVECDPVLAEEHRLLTQVAALARRAAQALDGPADIEWVADDRNLWLVQARPITTLAKSSSTQAAILEWTDLYLTHDDALQAYQPLPGFAHYFRSKRAPLARFACEHGVAAGRALLIRANRRGLSQNEGAESLATLFSSPRAIIDFSNEVRQQIVDVRDLAGRLLELAGEACVTFVVREFIAGDYGLLTQALPDSRTLCEFSADGLLAINRGSAATTTAVLGATGAVTAGSSPPVARLEVVAALTQVAQSHFGCVQLEWVVCNGSLSLVDFSPVKSGSLHHEEDGVRTISPGYAEGVCVIVDANRELQEVSVSARVSIDEIPAPESLGTGIADLVAQLRSHDGGAIVVCPRPYAALAAVLPFVKGFVFEQASVLCHLAILLREHGVPAIASTRHYQAARSQARVIVAART